jgi:hypothetical protein
MDQIIGWILFTSFIIVTLYLFITRNKPKFTPPDVIIGSRKYYDTLNNVFINVIDFDGDNVFYKFDVEGNDEIKILSKEAFLKMFRKAAVKDLFDRNKFIP